MRNLSLLLGLSVLATFAVMVVCQHQIVFPQHDDYGYAVLDYVTAPPGVEGRGWGLWALLQFVWGNYLKWTGRVGAVVALCGTYRLGVEAVRVTQCAVLISVPLLVTLLCTRDGPKEARRTFSPSIVIPIVVLLCIPSKLTVGGLYWFAASACYAWGAPALLAAAAFARVRGRLTWQESGLLAIAGLFSEPFAAASVCFACVRAVPTMKGMSWTHQIRARLAYLAGPLCTAMIVVLAPGNFARKAVTPYEMESALHHVAENYAGVCALLLNGRPGGAEPFLVVWLGAVASATLAVAVHLPMWVRLATVVAAMSAVPLTVSQAIPTWAILPTLVLATGLLLRWMAREDDDDRAASISLACLFAAVASAALLIAVSPGIAPRSILTPFLVLIVPVSYLLLSGLRARIWPRAFSAILIAIMASLGLVNSIRIYQGHRDNAHIHVGNDVALERARLEFHESGHVRSPITLTRLPRPEFAEHMPWHAPKIEAWVKKYYHLPQSAELVYVDP